MSGSGRDQYSPVAGQVPVDSSTIPYSNGETVQEVLEDVSNAVSASSSPGFTWGRSGNISSGSWLLNDSVPSNKAGRTIVLGDSRIIKIFSATEDLNTYTLNVYSHDGNEINLTLLTTLTVTSSRSGDSGTISVAVPNGKQLAVQMTTGSSKNLVVGVILQGDTGV